MNPSEHIDHHIAELTDWRGHMIARLRNLILEADPAITEDGSGRLRSGLTRDWCVLSALSSKASK